jgi:glycosyltransferase involved in cell wall biosynthesis
VTVSEFSAGEIVRHLGVDRQRIVVVPHGAPTSVSGEDYGERRPVVLYVGSLFSRRHIPDLISGFAQAARAGPDATLVLVGDNRATPPIDPHALAERAGVAGRVEWREYVDDLTLADLYRSARVFAFLSDYEGFAMTPLEAMAHDVPVVLLDTPVSREVYGEAARLVDASADSLASALLTLLTDERACAVQRAAGRGLLDRYTWPPAASTLRTVLEAAAR